jgi:hypothetical protein
MLMEKILPNYKSIEDDDNGSVRVYLPANKNNPERRIASKH